jgi:hypothetical protein
MMSDREQIEFDLSETYMHSILLFDKPVDPCEIVEGNDCDTRVSCHYYCADQYRGLDGNYHY